MRGASQQARRLLHALHLQSLGAAPYSTSFQVPIEVLSQGLKISDPRAPLTELSLNAFEWQDANYAWSATSLLSFFGRVDNCLEYSFSPVFRQFLSQSGGRATLQSAFQHHVSKGPTLALYELAAPWSGKGKSPWWGIEQVRQALGCADSPYYSEFKHFNAKILKPALTELSSSSDLNISIETRRTGRSVATVRFLVERNPAFAVIDALPGVADERVLAWTEAGASQQLAQHFVVCGLAWNTEPHARPSSTHASTQDRAARLAVIHRFVSQADVAQRAEFKRTFSRTLSDRALVQDFERFGWMSARNATAICSFWEQREPEAFAALRKNRDRA